LTEQLAKFKKFKRRFTLAAADVGTGEYVEFTQKNIKYKEAA